MADQAEPTGPVGERTALARPQTIDGRHRTPAACASFADVCASGLAGTDWRIRRARTTSHRPLRQRPVHGVGPEVSGAARSSSARACLPDSGPASPHSRPEISRC
jgi:hypothetical protein